MIEEYIPFGHENRVSREWLRAILHKPDREIRRMIEQAVDRNILIVSADGGYFRPTKKDSFYVRQYFGKEERRFRTISHKRKMQKMMWERLMPVDTKQFPGQLSLFE